MSGGRIENEDVEVEVVADVAELLLDLMQGLEVGRAVATRA